MKFSTPSSQKSVPSYPLSFHNRPPMEIIIKFETLNILRQRWGGGETDNRMATSPDVIIISVRSFFKKLYSINTYSLAVLYVDE